MFVHDLHQFVTVQLLEETLAVISQGKLCKDHGYSYERVSGQEPRLTQSAKSIICKIDNFVPLVVPGLSVNSESSSSSTTPSPESLGPEASPASGNKAAASSCSDSVLGRSDETSSGKLGQESSENDENDPLADMPFWVEDFTVNLIPTEVPSPAHISKDSEHSTKVATKSRKHGIFTHFPKDRNCDVCLRTKITKASCRRRTGESLPRAEKFGDLITADHKVFDKGCESERQSPVRCRVQDLSTLWIQSYPCETKFAHETEKSFLKFLEPSHRPKVDFTDNSMEFGEVCEDLSWNHRTSTPHRSETNGIAERAVRRVKEGTSAVLPQSGLDERWWSDSMECYCYLRNVQDLLADGKTPYE